VCDHLLSAIRGEERFWKSQQRHKKKKEKERMKTNRIKNFFSDVKKVGMVEGLLGRVEFGSKHKQNLSKFI
jgi:hypothetical protein